MSHKKVFFFLYLIRKTMRCWRTSKFREDCLSHLSVSSTSKNPEVISLNFDKQVGLERDGTCVCVCVCVMSFFFNTFIFLNFFFSYLSPWQHSFIHSTDVYRICACSRLGICQWFKRKERANILIHSTLLFLSSFLILEMKYVQ